MKRRNATALGAAAALAAVAGCTSVSGGPQAPPWLAESIAQTRDAGAPVLASLPEPSAPLRPLPAWESLDQALLADMAALQISPRSAPAPADAAEAGESFEREARSTFKRVQP